MRYDYSGKPFLAHDPDGRGYLLEPVYRRRAEAAPEVRKFEPRDCVGLLTEDGRWVRRDGRGRYAILGTSHDAEVALASYDAGAI